MSSPGGAVGKCVSPSFQSHSLPTVSRLEGQDMSQLTMQAGVGFLAWFHRELAWL
jgi:hypothetical protein